MSTFVYMTRCDGCGHCVDICPSDIMHIDKQCCSIKYAERLKELGVLQDSLFYHTHSDFGILPKSYYYLYYGGFFQKSRYLTILKKSKLFISICKALINKFLFIGGAQQLVQNFSLNCRHCYYE